jgi:hypothetical protein
MVGGLGGFTKEAIDLEAQLHSQFNSLRRVFQAHSKVCMYVCIYVDDEEERYIYIERAFDAPRPCTCFGSKKIDCFLDQAHNTTRCDTAPHRTPSAIPSSPSPSNTHHLSLSLYTHTHTHTQTQAEDDLIWPALREKAWRDGVARESLECALEEDHSDEECAYVCAYVCACVGGCG